MWYRLARLNLTVYKGTASCEIRSFVFCHHSKCIRIFASRTLVSLVHSHLSSSLFSSPLLSSPLLQTNESCSTWIQLRTRASHVVSPQWEAKFIQIKVVISFTAIIHCVTDAFTSPTFFILPSVSWPTTISQHQSYSCGSRPFLQQSQHSQSTSHVSRVSSVYARWWNEIICGFGSLTGERVQRQPV